MKPMAPMHNLRELQLALSHEHPKINAEIRRHLETLPDNTRRTAEHLLLSGGKRLRPLLTLLTGRALGCKDDALYTLGAAIEMVHSATLLHDDILDNSHLRRGQSAAHIQFGAVPALLSGDALLAKALRMVASFGDSGFIDCVAEAVMRTAEGEIAEFACLRNTALSHSDYLGIITGKTAWMLRAACELGALRAQAKPPLVEAAALFGLELGIAFQIVDDALDFYPSRAKEGTGKPRGGDLREGKVTPPLLFHLEGLSAHEAALFRENFADNAFSDADLERICDEIYTRGCVARTRNLAEEHLGQAEKALAVFPPTREHRILCQMTRYILTREE
ncbi:MAG: polyprenyl synthetase family protein [Desulfovibrio sp.]|jgi:octaprenyl-diphosphate synthase|nr:polyprenyl synthetase family protein [Desulfovibrio sp.]